MRASVKTMIIGFLLLVGPIGLLEYLSTLSNVDVGTILLLGMVVPLALYGGLLLMAIGFLALIFGK
jgi:hypothetical protein